MRAHIFVLAASLTYGTACSPDTGDAQAPGTASEGGTETGGADVATASEGITAADFSRRIGVLAHDSMRGRATPSPELEATAVWIASELEDMGVAPGTDTGFQQRYVIEVPGSEAAAIEAPNVVGILRGSDPALRDEYIVFSAHMDHVGVGRPDARGDSIFNGADDDASGTSAVLEIAEAFSELGPAPRRSLIFLFVSGEERGLWGSRFFTEHPPVPLERVVANLNLDMVGRNWTDSIVAIGRGHSDLGRTLDLVASRHPELRMTPLSDPWPAESFYTRSDHYNFAQKGVPILFFFNGTHEDYHRPSDELARIDAEKGARVARLVFHLGLEIANRDERPAWDPESYRQIVTGER